MEDRTIALYERLRAACATENQRNRVHIRLENRLTPAEFVTLRDHYLGQRPLRRTASALGWRLGGPALAHLGITPAPPSSREPADHTRVWLDTLQGQYRLAGRSRPEPFAREPIANGVTRYAGVGPRAARTLVIGFTGDWQRMMMPTPTFLQHLPADRADVVLVRSGKGDAYVNGIRGAGADLTSSIERLRTLVGIDGYDRVVTMGTSGGALPGLLAAYHLEADATLVVGGLSPADPRWAGYFGGRDAGGHLARLIASSPRHPYVTLVYTSEHPEDASHAEATVALLPPGPLRVVTVPGVDHNSLIHIQRAGELPALLNDALLRASASAR